MLVRLFGVSWIFDGGVFVICDRLCKDTLEKNS
jgi:hypothetical protein